MNSTHNTTNTSAESYVLGCMALKESLCLHGFDYLEPEYFTGKDFAKIFSLLKEMKEEASGFGLGAFSLFLDKEGHDKKYLDLLKACADTVTATANFDYAIKVVIEKAGLARKKSAVVKFLRDVKKEGAEKELFADLDKINQRFNYRALEKFDVDSLADSLSEPGIGLGIDGIYSLDNRPGTVTVIAARTSEGKTTFMLNSMLNLVIENPNKTFLFYSYEEERRYLFVKIFIILMGWKYPDHSVFHRGSSYRKASEFLRNIGTCDDRQILDIYNLLKNMFRTGSISIISEKYNEADLDKSILNWVGQKDVGCVFIDYIQKIPASKKGARFEDMQKVSAGVLEMAIRRNVPIVIGAQMNREATKATPTLGMIRECGDIEQDANSVIMLQKHDGQDRDTPVITATILKAREGVRSYSRAVKYDFDGQRLRIQKI